MDQIELPYTLMCGNHDNRDNLLHVFPDTPVTDQGHVQDYVDIDGTRLIMIDTLDGPPYRNDYHKGYLCADRLNWIDNALSSAPGRVLLFMHHPAWIVGLDGMDEIRMYNDTEALNTFKKYNNVAHLFTGHLHRSISGNIQGLSFTTFKSPGHQTPLFVENLHISQSTPEPAAYGVVFLAENIIVHTEDFQLALDNVENCIEALPEANAA